MNTPNPIDLARAVQMFTPGGTVESTQTTPLNPLQPQPVGSAQNSVLQGIAQFMPYMRGLMAHRNQGVPLNPYALGGGGVVDAGSMPVNPMFG